MQGLGSDSFIIQLLFETGWKLTVVISCTCVRSKMSRRNSFLRNLVDMLLVLGFVTCLFFSFFCCTNDVP